jgi:sigma-E factor negative regulatory protein RseA
MNPEISALMDGELEQHAAKTLITQLQSDKALQQSWSVYHQIGDCLRREHMHDDALTSKIFAGLQAEPTILAPRPRTAGFAPIIATAMAASLATVAVVSWLGYQSSQAPVTVVAKAVSQPAPDTTKVVQLKSSVESVALLPNVSPVVISPNQVQDYLFAHQEFSPAAGVMQASFGGRR